MKILLTGASSFTGYWFAETLSRAGHQVLALLRGSACSGGDLQRAERLRRLHGKVEIVPSCPFGSPSFLDIVNHRDFDVLCHHGAEVGDYRSSDFDIAGAVSKNTHNLRAVLHAMSQRSLKGVVLTGSFFECDEGAGSQPLAAFSAYGVSKGLSAQIVRYRCHEIGIRYGKFVIPHPFGPLEQPRLGAYLARTWAAGGVAEIRTPAYIRDNIHVGLLAACYRHFVEETLSSERLRKLNPSGYVESQGAFVERLAREVGCRIRRDCRVQLLRQTEFSEPLVRVNTDPAAIMIEGWDESAAWNEYAEQFE
jgi:nucleoside-diphosphate-sugar epimerase